MIEDLFYLRESVVDVDAAVVGISKQRWVALSHEEATEKRAQEVMRKHQFDVLPIEASPDIVREFYCASNWNDFNAIKRREISYDDVIPFTTPLRTVIKSFAHEKRLFYFLTNEHRITGLISIANLNCRQVLVYLFSLISELEIRLSDLVGQHVSDGDILSLNIHKSARGRYNQDQKKGFDVSLREYLYLSDLVMIITKHKLFGILGYDNPDTFDSEFKEIKDLRNEVAHPTKSLIKDADSVAQLWSQIQRIERGLFSLRQWVVNTQVES